MALIMASPAEQHHSNSPDVARCAVITVSDTRTLETDSGGARLIELLEEAGHRLVARAIVPDDPAPMHALLEKHHIAVMPGESFGTAAAGHIRVAMTIEDTRFAQALATVCDFAESLAA